jgi:D-hexose-6-phosphate mutarotase
VAEVYLYGACTTSWKTAEGKDLLFVRPDAVFTGQKPISGGIPHCFPQFGPGSIQQATSPLFPFRVLGIRISGSGLWEFFKCRVSRIVVL